MVRTYVYNPSISSHDACLPASEEFQRRTKLLQQLHQQYERTARHSDKLSRQLALEEVRLAAAKPPRPPEQHPSPSTSTQPQQPCPFCSHDSSGRQSKERPRTKSRVPESFYEYNGAPLSDHTNGTQPYRTIPSAYTRQKSSKRYRPLTRSNSHSEGSNQSTHNNMIGLSNQQQQNDYNRAKQRSNQLAYQEDLKRQAYEQKLKRAQDDHLYGGSGMGLVGGVRYNEEPFWFKPAAQPGGRSAPLWYSHEKNIAELHRQSSLPLNNGATAGLYNQFGAQSNGPRNARTIVQEQAAMRAMQNRQKTATDYNYDPFGKGGGGAPIRDAQGRLVTDRRRMNRSWNQEIDTNRPHEYDFASSAVHASHGSRAGGRRQSYQPTILNPKKGITSSGDYGAYSSPFGGILEHQNQIIGGGGPGQVLPSGTVLDSYQSVFGVGTNNSPATNGYSSYASHDPNVIKAPTSNEKDSYKIGLLQQIEEKKRLEALEKERERQQEERERRYNEQIQERQRREMEREKQVAQEKAAEAERKRSEIAERARQRQIELDRQAKDANRTHAVAQDDGLEWWERQPSNNRPTSRAVTRQGQTRQSNRGQVNPPPEGTIDTFDTLHPEPPAAAPRESESRRSRKPSTSRRRRSSVGSSRSAYRPTSGNRRNEKQLRQLSATRERLAKEQARVRHALETDGYNEDIFSDDDDLPTNFNSKSSRRRRSVDDDDLGESSNFMRRSERMLAEDDILSYDNDSVSKTNDPFKQRKSTRKTRDRDRDSHKHENTSYFSDDDI